MRIQGLAVAVANLTDDPDKLCAALGSGAARLTDGADTAAEAPAGPGRRWLDVVPA